MFEACLLICFIACFQPCLDITCTKSSLLFSPSVKSMEFHTKWKPSPNPSLTLWSKYGPHIYSFTGISLDWTVWKNHISSPKKEGWNFINSFKDKSYILFQIKIIGQTLMENVHWCKPNFSVKLQMQYWYIISENLKQFFLTDYFHSINLLADPWNTQDNYGRQRCMHIMSLEEMTTSQKCLFI